MDIKKINGIIPFKQKYKEMFVINQYNSSKTTVHDHSDTIDSDANAFMTATGITNDSTVYFSGTAQQIIGSDLWKYVNWMIRDWKANGLWTKTKAMYPFVGGSASTHKWNAKDPRDLDAAFRLTYSGSLTHSGTGMKGNGGWAIPHMNPYAILDANNKHYSLYSRTAGNMNGAEFGNTHILGDELFLRWSDNITYAALGVNEQSGNINLNPQGYFLLRKSQSYLFDLFRNNVNVHSFTGGTSQANTEILILCRTNGVSYYSLRELAFFSFGENFTNDDSMNAYNIVNEFEENLKRNV